MMSALRRTIKWAFVIGGISFVIGFIGPMILAPGANQGPLLGIFVTGPLGTLAGLGIGVVRELAGYTASPFEVFSRRSFLPTDRTSIYRAVAVVGGSVLLINGLITLPKGEGRPAAASIVIGAVLLYYAAAGRVPAWFRR